MAGMQASAPAQSCRGGLRATTARPFIHPMRLGSPMGGGRAVKQRHTLHVALPSAAPAPKPEAVRLGRRGSIRARARGAALALGRMPPRDLHCICLAAGHRRLAILNAALPSRGVAPAA